MKGLSCSPNDQEIIVYICFGTFWVLDENLSYDRITIHFRIRVFTHTRWLFSHCLVCLPDACGNMFFYCQLVSAQCPNLVVEQVIFAL